MAPIPVSESPQAGAARTNEALVAAIDLAEAYDALSGRLEQIVRLAVRAPEEVIEDACQFAWGRLVHHAGSVRRDTALSWLAKTAIHEAFKLIRRDGRELSLEVAIEQLGRTTGPVDLVADPPELLERRERLALIRNLPERQQRLLWLHALGLSYAEIACYAGCTTRTVERQLLRAKRTMRGLARK